VNALLIYPIRATCSPISSSFIWPRDINPSWRFSGVRIRGSAAKGSMTYHGSIHVTTIVFVRRDHVMKMYGGVEV
jgi:hypothetical protein